MSEPKRMLSPRGRKAKGSDYEREVAAHLSAALGIHSRRALLSGGGRNDGGADVEGAPLLHLELKRTETFAPYAAMAQAEAAIRKSRDRSVMPVVVNRRNRMSTGESLVVMRMDHWLLMYRDHLKARSLLPAGESEPVHGIASPSQDSTGQAPL